MERRRQIHTHPTAAVQIQRKHHHQSAVSHQRLVYYGLPALIIVIIIVAYLVIEPDEESTASSSSVSSSPPLLLWSSASSLPASTSSSCSPLNVWFDADRHCQLLQCSESVLGGEYASVNISIFQSHYIMAAVGLIDSLYQDQHQPQQKAHPHYLLMGLATGHIATIIQHTFHAALDIIEPDPLIVKIAEAYFSFKAQGSIQIQHPASYLANIHYSATDNICQQQAAYTVIIVDIVAVDVDAELLTLSLYSQAALKSFRCLLAAEGVLVLNLLYSSSASSSSPSLYQTLLQVFPHIRVFRDGGSTDQVNQLIFFASQHPINFNLSRIETLRESSAAESDGGRDADSEAADGQLLTHRYQTKIWKKMHTQWELPQHDIDKKNSSDRIYCQSPDTQSHDSSRSFCLILSLCMSWV